MSENVERRASRRALLLAGTVAVALGIGIAVWRLAGPDESVEEGIALVRPVGTVSASAARRFEWRELEGTHQYRLELISQDEATVFATETAGTSLTLPDSVLLGEATYRWWVWGERRAGPAVRSQVVEFTVRPR